MGALVWPKYAENATVTITFEAEGLDTNGGPITSLIWTGHAIVNLKRKRTIDAEGKEILCQGSILAEGDIAPGIALSAGSVMIYGQKYKINGVSRTPLPGGRIFHTRMELY